MLNFQHDDSRIRTPAEVAAGVIPVNYAYAPGNVLRYGADPTGVNDSLAAFNAAISANDDVYVPTGDYLILGALDEITSSLRLHGDGRASRLIFNTTDDCIVFNVSLTPIEQAGNYVVSKLAFDNVTNTPSSFILSGNTDQGSVNGLIEKCYFSNCAATYCIDNYIGYGLKIRECIFSDVTGSGVRFRDSTNQANGYSFVASIERCDFTRPSANAIVIQGAQVLNVRDTIIESCGGAGLLAQPLTNSVQAWDIHLDNVYFESNTGEDINIGDCDASYWATMLLTACTFVGTPTIVLGERSEITIIACGNSGGSTCTVSGTSSARAILIHSFGFSQSGTYPWVEIGGVNSTENTTVPLTFSPTLGADTTNPTLGNGTLVAYYTRVGNNVWIYIELTIGSTTTTGTGNWFLSGLPFTAHASINSSLAAELFDNSANANYPATARVIKNTGTARVISVGTTGNGVDPAQPFTWATGDILRLSGTYACA